jgi:lambda repressor-like predicted transcriptional regulator
MVDTMLFKAEMVRSGHTQRSLSKAAKMSVNSLNAKLNNKGIFDTEEVQRICDVMGITDNDLKCKIFLAKLSQK